MLIVDDAGIERLTWERLNRGFASSGNENLGQSILPSFIGKKVTGARDGLRVRQSPSAAFHLTSQRSGSVSSLRLRCLCGAF